MIPEQQLKQAKSKKIELILQQLNTLPTLPSVAARLLQITVKSNTQANEVVRLIESDSSLASRIIAMASSASTGLSRHTVSLSKAVVLLGFNAVRNAVLSIKVFEAMGKDKSSDDADGVFDRIGFWKHNLAVACAAKMLIKHIDNRIDPEEAFVCGLLHDIGKLALVTCLPKSYQRVVSLTESSLGNIAEVEQKVLGIDHTVAGKRLTEKWQLPSAITETVWLHHQWVQGLPDIIKNHSLIQTVHLADILAREQRIGFSGNHYFPDSASSVARELGCPPDAVNQVSRQLREVIKERATLLGLDEIAPEELYLEALGEANSELGQLNERLGQQNRILQLRSDYFDLLGNLADSVRTSQNVVEVCGLVAELWQNHIQCSRCAVYAMDQNASIIEGVVKLETDSPGTMFLVDRSEDPASQMHDLSSQEMSREFNMSTIGQSHYWFFEQVAPMFEMGATLTLPLRTGDELIGGIIWQDDKDRSHYLDQFKEIQAFTASVAMALRQAQIHQQQNKLCEQMAQSNELLHQTQRELLQKRNLAAVGEMAGGAAHEINNPLAVIVGRSQLLASSETDPERKKILEKISQQGQLITDIISELMEFAKPSRPNSSVMTVQEIITQACANYKKSSSLENITIEAAIPQDLPDVYVDGPQISFALAELILNAAESYQENGDSKGDNKITISVSFDELDNEVAIDIIDKGCGMDEQTLVKAMDPFFSHQRAGRKRGLGLSRSLRHIEDNGGSLRLNSREGKGTTAVVKLPIPQISHTN